MPILACPSHSPAPKNNNPIPTDLSPEQALGVAVLRQALADLHSGREHIRADALRFWGDAGALQFWDDVVDLGGRLKRYSQALLLGGVLLLLPACIPPPGSDAARAVDKVFGVPSQEQQAYCRVVQDTYLKATPPQMPPSCADIVKASKAPPAVQP